MAQVFALTMPVWEIALRATIVYLALLLLLRVVPKRNAGHISPNDLLTLIVIGGIGTDAIMGGSTSAGDAILLIALITVWAYVFDSLEYRFPALRGLLRDPPARLIDKGRLVRTNMRRELVTEQEIMAVLRKEGIDGPAGVESAWIEADGEISVIARKGR